MEPLDDPAAAVPLAMEEGVTMHILVIGATGFLGSHIARNLAQAGHEVSGLSRAADRDAAISAAGAEPLRGDLSDREGVIGMMRRHDAPA